MVEEGEWDLTSRHHEPILEGALLITQSEFSLEYVLCY